MCSGSLCGSFCPDGYRLKLWACVEGVKKMWLKRIKIIFLLFLAFCFTACGKADNKADMGPEMGINGYVYQSSQVPDEESLYIMTLRAGSNALYFKWKDGIYTIPVEENMDFGKRELLIADPDLQDYVLGQDGILYYVTAGDATETTGYLSVSAGCTLIKAAEDGTQEWEKSFPDVNIFLTGNCLAVDGNGQVFLLSEDTLCRIDKNGDMTDAIPIRDYQISGGSRKLVSGEQGKVYFCAARYGNNDEPWEIYEVTGQEGSPLKKISGKKGMPFSSACGLLCDSPDGIVYQYRDDTSAWEPVFRWGDSCLSSPNTNSSELVQIDEEHFCALLPDVATDSFNSILYRLVRKAVSDLPEKEVLVLASSEYISNSLKEWVSRFNRENGKYHIILELYGMDEVDTKLNSRLVSADPPDLVDVSGLDVVSYGEKQTFEDLAPFLEDSEVLDKDLFFDGLLESYTIDGRLVCIPKEFSVDAVFARTSEVGADVGWTAEEVMALAEKHPDRRLLQMGSDGLIRRLFGTWLCERYIDWESGECTFDSEEFRVFLEWLKTYTDRVQRQFGDIPYDYINLPEDCLLYNKSIWTMGDRAVNEWKLGEPVTFIGYPTPDAHPCIPVEIENAVCIMSHSGNKEGAWQFLEYLLSREEGSRRNFSSRQDIFRRKLEEEMTPDYYYLAEDGSEVMLESLEEGEEKGITEISMKSKVWVRDGDNEVVLYYYMSQEQADALLEIFEALDFTPGGGPGDKVLDIIVEESAAYLDGTRTVQETAEIIQNRVKNLVQERL